MDNEPKQLKLDFEDTVDYEREYAQNERNIRITVSFLGLAFVGLLLAILFSGR